MIRDPGPIRNIGHSVTSRDVPTTGEETDGISPNSGILSRVVNGNPIVGFFASTAATMAGAMVASKLTKAGGLRLAKSIQQQADVDPSGFSSTLVKNITDLRRHLDELQGLTRAGGDEAYNRLVFDMPDGRLGTGIDLNDRLQEVNGLGFLKAEERRGARNALFNEPSVVWTFRDTLQQKMVRAGRRLPYELPAFYVAQRAITDPLMGEKTVEERKVNWYNPVDVITDFTKESITAAATMILPFEFAGAAANQTRSSIHTIRHSARNLDRLTPIEQKMHRGLLELDELTRMVGHRLNGLHDRFLRTSAQASGALSAVSDPYRNKQGFVQNLHSLRHGYESAKEKVAKSGDPSKIARGVRFTDLFSRAKMQALTGEAETAVLTDLLPGFSGLGLSRKQFMEEFRLQGQAFDVLSGKTTIDTAKKNLGIVDDLTDNRLLAAMDRISGASNSRLLKAAEALSGGTPTFFRQAQKEAAFKGKLERAIAVKLGLQDPSEDVLNFVRNLKVSNLPEKSGFDATELVTIGKVRNYGVPGASNFADNNSYFENILKRYSTIRTDSYVAKNLSAEEFESAVVLAARAFRSDSGLTKSINKQWDLIAKNHLGEMGANLAGRKKVSYLSFKNETQEGTSELARLVARTLNIRADTTNGLRRQLAARGINPDNFTEMRSFLIRNRKMSSGVIAATINKDLQVAPVKIGDVTKRDAKGQFVGYDQLDENLKRIVSKEQHDGLTKIVGASRGTSDALSTSLESVALSGLYRKTANGGIGYLNYSGIKNDFSSMANFFMDEFRIPILGFNPFNLFGKSSFNAMANSAPIQYVSGRSVQPFVKDIGIDDFGIFFKTGRAKGKIIKVSTTDKGTGIDSEILKGTYRPVASDSNELLSRYARTASNISGVSPYDIRADIEGRGLTRSERIRKRLNVDIDQPDSIGGFVKRFRGRHFDVQNPTTLAKLLRGDEIVRYSGGRKQVLVGQPVDGKIRIVDKNTGEIVKTVSEQDVFKGLDVIRRTSDQYGVASRAIEAAEEASLFNRSTLAGVDDVPVKNLTDIKSPTQLIQYLNNLFEVEESILESLDNDVASQIRRSQQKIRGIVRSSDLSALSPKSSGSPTITTVLDDVKTAVFKHRLTTESILRKPGVEDPFIAVSRIMDELVESGGISSAQRAESKASLFGALQDKAAFRTFDLKDSVVVNQGKANAALLKNKEAFKAFSEPYASNAVAGIAGPVRKRLAPLNSLTNGYFSTSKHTIEDFTTDPLGSGQRTTFVPTFGTVFDRDPVAATMSVMGVNTYKNPEAYSNMSAVPAHVVGRLNKYFGSVGAGLGGGYSGPLSEFGLGMVASRVVPAYIAAQTFITADRTAGGLVNETDADGERVYSPLLMGSAARAAVEVQSVLSGIVPGGPGYQDKRDELLEGEVAIRQGRYWPLGVTPFKGGKIQYYRPSYYRRLQAGAMYTDDTYGSPFEKFMFYNDVSPLRPLDPYRFEKKHYEDRPYPITGEYFTGPFGPVTSLANMTIGKVLKPRRMMHEEELRAGLANYMPAGEFGAYDASAYFAPAAVREQPSIPGPPVYGAAPTSDPAALPGGFSQVAGYNAELASRAGPTGQASGMVRSDISLVNSRLVDMSYGPPKQSGVMTPSLVAAGSPLAESSFEYQLGEFGYRSQEMAGIYGFASANVREVLGFGDSDLAPQRSVLQSAGRAYGSSRSFWDLNLGGLGDVPLPSQGGIGNMEFSEVVRRFIPRQRSDVDFINPIRNTMADQYPFLPGPEYFTNFQTGDPYTKVQEGEIRLPGTGYERLNRLYSDASGRYGAITQLDILADVAPYSKQFRNLNRQIDTFGLSPDERIKVAEIREQVESRTAGAEFSEYKYKDASAEELGMQDNLFRLSRLGEMIAHSDNFILNKAIGDRTAVEDWERKNVYGSTFPQWQNPVSSFVAPMVNKATQDNPLVASTGLAVLGSLFGATPRAKAFGATLGGLVGAGAGTYGQVSEAITGQRYIPENRKQELALEEYADILSYVKSSRLASIAQRSGDYSSAVAFRRQAQSTMYGADLQNINTEMLKYAIPKRKREHFETMIQETDEGERERILSTAGRLERRIYQAAWGMRVEKRPELDEYFERHELPDESWEGWHPNTNMEHIKIKMGQSMGLDMSQMGYYPQQISQANLANPSYPSFFSDEKSEDMFLRLKSLMSGMGISGSVIPVANTFGSQNINVSYGVNYG